jgi:O-antigen ligase
VFVIATLVLAAGWGILPPEQRARFESMGDDQTSLERLDLWDDAERIIAENPFLGLGYDNWYAYQSTIKGLFTVAEVHNTVLEAATELGIPGLGLFLALIAMTFLTNRDTRRRVAGRGPWGSVLSGMALGLDMCTVGFFFASLFMSVLFYPFFWMLFAMVTSLSIVARKVQAREPVVASRHPAVQPGRRARAATIRGRRLTAANQMR